MYKDSSNNARDELIERMGRAVSRVNGVYAKAEKLMGLNSNLSNVLYAISFADGITQSEICDAYEMPKQTVNNVVRQLIDDGLVEVRADSANRKSKPLFLTEKGCAFTNEVLKPMKIFERRVLKDMGEDSYAKLIELLEEEAGAIERALEKGCLLKDVEPRN